MSYREYVIAAYAVFGIVLAWDFIAPRLDVRRQLRAAKLRAARAAARPETSELRRTPLQSDFIE
jgi:heme exporter protein D